MNEYLVTELLRQRNPHERNHEAESREYQTLIRQMADDTVPLLPALAQMAVRLCDARSSAFCLLESAVEMEQQQFASGGATSVDPAPASEFLGNHFNVQWRQVDQTSPQLYRLPPGLGETCENLTREPIELLVIPLRIEGEFIGLIWVAKLKHDRQFDSTDLQIMRDLATCGEKLLQSISQKQVPFPIWLTAPDAEVCKDVDLTELAHELRHPLASLRDAVEILRVKSPQMKECEAAKSVIHLQLSRLTHLIDDLLEISRLYLSKRAIRQEGILLSNLLYRSIEAALAHELRQPLTPLQNAIDVLRNHSPPLWECDWAHDVVERQMRHLHQLIDDLLDISRILLNKLVLRKKPVSLSSILNHAIEAIRPSIEINQHDLIIRRGDIPLSVEADPSRLGQIFLRLLNYAAKSMRPGGQVVLTAGREGRYAVVTIRDTGIGLAAAVFSRKFVYYTQVGASPQQAEGGLGVGLALVRQLVGLHGGTVHAQSEGIGQGSEFIVRLPLDDSVPHH